MPSPAALIFKLGADSGPFKAEMAKMQGIARASAVSLNASMASGMHGGYSAIIRESITIPREIASGRGIGRVAASGAILLQYLGALISRSKQAGGALLAQAEAYDTLARRASLTAISLRENAREMLKKRELEGHGAGDIAAVNALVAQAKQYENQATVLSRQSEILKKNAELQAANAAASKLNTGILSTQIPMLWSIVAIVGAIAAAWAYAYYQAKKTVDILSGPILGERDTGKINNQLYGLSKVDKAWRDIDRSVKEVSAHYDSATEAAKRLAETTRAEFEHDSKMNELAKEIAMASEKDPKKRYEIEKEYSDKAVQLLKDQHKKEADERATELENQEKESKRGRTTVNQMLVGLNENETNNLNIANAERGLKETNDWLAAHQKLADEDPNRIKVYASGYQETVGSTEEYQQYIKQKAAQATMTAKIVEAKKQAAADADTWRQIDDLKKQVDSAEKRAAELRKSGNDLKSQAAQREADFAKEEIARLGLVQANEDKAAGRGGRGTQSLNSLQRIGGQHIVATIADQHLQVAKRTEHHVRGIQEHLTRQGHHGRNGSLGEGRF